jgi:hypothetical protein
MKIQFNTYVVGGYVPGQTVNLPDDQAVAHLNAGVATVVVEIVQPETATVPPAVTETRGDGQ